MTLLRKKGARVVVLDMRIPSKAEWEDGVIYYQCDVSDNQRVSELAKQIEQEVSVSADTKVAVILGSGSDTLAHL